MYFYNLLFILSEFLNEALFFVLLISLFFIVATAVYSYNSLISTASTYSNA